MRELTSYAVPYYNIPPTMPIQITHHHRRSIRLTGYDYSRTGAYFITICTQNRERLFGNVINGSMALNDAGVMACQYWQVIPIHYPNVILDEFVVMPNHIHGILILDDNVHHHVGAQDSVPLPIRVPLKTQCVPEHRFQKIIPRSIGAIIRGYKIGVTKWMRENTDMYAIWQRNYHEHIIRDDESFQRIRHYIANNPLHWGMDDNNPVPS